MSLFSVSLFDKQTNKHQNSTKTVSSKLTLICTRFHMPYSNARGLVFVTLCLMIDGILHSVLFFCYGIVILSRAFILANELEGLFLLFCIWVCLQES